MSKLSLAINNTQCYLLMQGIKMLLAENAIHKATISMRMIPGDQNIATLLEYYDKRSVQLQIMYGDLDNYMERLG